MRHYNAVLLALAGGALLLAASPAAADETVGRVVAVRGTVKAQAPGQPLRDLECNDAIYEGDRIITSRDSKLGMISGDIYSGMNERTTLEYTTTEEGTPKLALEQGHLRVLDSSQTDRARILTPGLLAYDAGTDTEAFAFPEKAWTVSMVCPWDQSLAVTRVAAGHEGTRPQPADCAIDKPREPLFTSAATHAKLPVIDDLCTPAIPVAAHAASRFASPADVALGPPPPVEAAGPGLSIGPPIAGAAGSQGLPIACDVPGTCAVSGRSRSGPGVRTSPFPFIGPP